jgi:hypothetical protein
MIHRPTDHETLAAMERLLRQRTDASACLSSRDFPHAGIADPERARRSRQTSHRFTLYERARVPSPPETGAYVPELGARLENDRNLTDGARRCARKLAEYAYRRDRKGRAAEITVSYLSRALGRCRRTVQRYLRLLEREGYVQVDVVYGDRSRMCAGLIVQLLSPLFARHHQQRWPGSAAFPDATRESQKESFSIFRTGKRHRIPAENWALKCMDGVFRSLMETLPPLDHRLRDAA